MRNAARVSATLDDVVPNSRLADRVLRAALATPVLLRAARPDLVAAEPRLSDSGASAEDLPFLDTGAANYRTPRAGEGFRTVVVGEDVTVPERDLRHIQAWKLGAQFESPSAAGRLVLPASALYFWDHPDSSHLLRAEVAGAYNDAIWTRSPTIWGNFEYGMTFRNFTLPEAWNEAYDGATDKAQQIYWGWVRPGFTLGYRRKLDTGHQDSMWQINWILEPSYFYSGRSRETSPNMVLPKSTFELRNRILLRYDRRAKHPVAAPSGLRLRGRFRAGLPRQLGGLGYTRQFLRKAARPELLDIQCLRGRQRPALVDRQRTPPLGRLVHRRRRA
jgi:hypothetical protein